MTGSWIISFAGRTYGPYSTRQLKDFAAEGRLAEQSLVARAGEKTFRKVLDEPELSDIFAPQGEEYARSAPLGRDGSAAFGRGEDRSRAGERAHFLVIADLKSGSVARLEETLAKLGQICAITPQAWLLSSDQPINSIRNLLVQQIGKLDLLFVVDASNDRAAWFNFGPEADARIRKLWRSSGKIPGAG